MVSSSLRNVISISLFFLAVCETPAKADDFGCQVLLCMSNPAGPMAVAQCVPPITKLYEDLAKGKAFPTCTGGGTIETSQPVYEPFYCSSGFGLREDQGTTYCTSSARTVTVACPVADNHSEEQTDGISLPFGGPIRTTDETGREVCKDFEYSTVQRHAKPQYMDVKIKATSQNIRVRF